MSLNLNFNFGRLLQLGERLTTARVNAIVRGISATITGLVGTSDLAPGAVTATIVTPDDFFYTDNCTLVGTTYTVSGFPVDPPALKDGMILYFKADATNPGSVNLQVGALGIHTISKYGGQPLVAGDIVTQQIVGVQYNTTLLAAPTWQMVDLPGNQFLPTSAPIQGSVRHLLAFNNTGTPATKVDLTVAEIVLKSAGGDPYVASTVALTANIAASGANGLDTGSVAANTWYYLWVIYNPTTNLVAALLSLSATAPTLPAGYTFRALAGTVHAGIVGGSTTDFMTFYQVDQEVYLNQTLVFTAKTAGGDDTYESYSAGAGGGDVDLRLLVPPIARKLRGNFGNDISGTDQSMAIAGDANGLGAQITAADGVGSGNKIDGFAAGSLFEVPLKTAQTVYWKKQGSTGHNRMSVNGYSL